MTRAPSAIGREARWSAPGEGMSSLRTGAIGDGLIQPGPGVPTVMPGNECACPTRLATTSGSEASGFLTRPRESALWIRKRRRRNDRGRFNIPLPNVASVDPTEARYRCVVITDVCRHRAPPALLSATAKTATCRCRVTGDFRGNRQGQVPSATSRVAAHWRR